ncbi:hypothetical protein CIHG_02968 [Coccidioides immitis H538.4]|uniref:Uncharacterized protein n=3 Tax=Coccidioides immitis TaxID=5501 RepID=A0A0J8R5M7_COCIT|nr:hypothetical protein CIRG_07675 [Coccidioides immitis RMSCC 2394]KMU79720.1 hypothetical protein CISG_02138 [Coccidioides immitis RMSCC 3703]KMU85185.1 hypothetical protein CIHG_02968 [Coccidioides immitis H538.4]
MLKSILRAPSDQNLPDPWKYRWTGLDVEITDSASATPSWSASSLRTMSRGITSTVAKRRWHPSEWTGSDIETKRDKHAIANQSTLRTVGTMRSSLRLQKQTCGWSTWCQHGLMSNHTPLRKHAAHRVLCSFPGVPESLIHFIVETGGHGDPST